MLVIDRFLATLSSVACGLLFPQTCVLCDRWVVNSGWVPLCEACAQAPRPKWGPSCDICGTLVHANILDAGYPCRRCREGNQPCHRIRSWGVYEGRLRKLIHAFKFDGLRRLALPLASHLLQCFREDFAGIPIDALVPVPLHSSRRRSRGFDQTLLLTTLLSRQTKIPIWQCVSRIRPTDPQSGLPRGTRLRNVSKAFDLVRPLRPLEGNRLLIVDDVLTTGATIEAVATLLHRSKVGWLGAITLGRTLDWH